MFYLFTLCPLRLEFLMADTYEKMDRMYRYQRYFYDMTRKYYLLGRDRLLDELDVKPGERILEVGCGTGRNLRILAVRHPDSNLYGLDASSAMLETARTKLDRAADITNIVLRKGLADTFRYDSTFGVERPFDKIFFSYSLSMIPPWRESVRNAIFNLQPRGRIFVVDFFDQRGWYRPFRIMLQAWLARFGVRHPEGIRDFLKKDLRNNLTDLRFEILYGGYSFLAAVECRSADI